MRGPEPGGTAAGRGSGARILGDLGVPGRPPHEGRHLRTSLCWGYADPAASTLEVDTRCRSAPDRLTVMGNVAANSLACGFGEPGLFQTLKQLLAIHDSSRGERSVEYKIFLATSDILRDRQIVRVQAETLNALGVTRR